MRALDAMLLGALQLPYISGSVPVKSNTAEPSSLLIVKANLIVLPSSIRSSAKTVPTGGSFFDKLSSLSIYLTDDSAFF